jgi:hypothetical protein
MDDGSPFNTLYLCRHGEDFQGLDVVHFPQHKVFEVPIRDHSDLQGRYLFHLNVHDRVGTVDFFDGFLLRRSRSAWYPSMQNGISGPFASIT